MDYSRGDHMYFSAMPFGYWIRVKFYMVLVITIYEKGSPRLIIGKPIKHVFFIFCLRLMPYQTEVATYNYIVFFG